MQRKVFKTLVSENYRRTVVAVIIAIMTSSRISRGVYFYLFCQGGYKYLFGFLLRNNIHLEFLHAKISVFIIGFDF